MTFAAGLDHAIIDSQGCKLLGGLYRVAGEDPSPDDHPSARCPRRRTESRHCLCSARRWLELSILSLSRMLGLRRRLFIQWIEGRRACSNRVGSQTAFGGRESPRTRREQHGRLPRLHSRRSRPAFQSPRVNLPASGPNQGDVAHGNAQRVCGNAQWHYSPRTQVAMGGPAAGSKCHTATGMPTCSTSVRREG